MIAMKPNYKNQKEWEEAWLNGETEWWPDSIELPFISSIQIRSGCPSSPLPSMAQDRIQKLAKSGEQYVMHVDVGVHAYKIGFINEYTTVK